MRLTNKANLSLVEVETARRQIYRPVPNVLRVSELIGPPKIKTLMMKHFDEIEVDVTDLKVPLVGTGGHLVHEQTIKDSNMLGVLSEHRMVMSIPGWFIDGDGKVCEEKDAVYQVQLKGSADVINLLTRMLEDFKFVSVFSYIFGCADGHLKYQEQFNVYRWLFYMLTGVELVGLQANLTFKDWQEYQKRSNDDYPAFNSMALPIKMWDLDVTKNFVNDRIKLHRENPMGDCTAEDRWEKPTTYAIKKEGQKKAVAATNPKTKKPMTTEAEAVEVIYAKGLEKQYNDGKGSITIECRPGDCTRCSRFCHASAFCDQYAAIVKAGVL